MIVVRKGQGEKFVPTGHAKMEAEKLFGTENGSQRATIHLSTLLPGGGMEEEVHDSSDQVFYVLSGSIVARSKGEQVGILQTGDGIHIAAGEPHAFRNEGQEDCVLYILTVPSLTS
jgi:quercetin dioxygenase-like cupin family protein